MLGYVALGLIIVIAGLWMFGPYEDATLVSDAGAVDPDLDAYFARVEAAFDDITPGAEKRVIWSGERGTKTDWSIRYVHGFSGTSEELRPVPDHLATALGANLIYTRLQGHGRSSDAMADATVQAWVSDLDEGLQAARIAGRKVLVIATSTGGTLVTALAQNAQIMKDVAGLIFVSPNYKLNNPVARFLSWPAARYWLPALAGRQRNVDVRSEAHGTFWTTSYPSVAVMPMAALIDAVKARDHSGQTIPALFWFSTADQIVRPEATTAMAAKWGGRSTVVNPVLGPDDDPYAHMPAGAVMSPSQTETTVAGMLDWIKGQVAK
jgi:alpha-beta hydrolase superfamily lysophospholipase